MEIKDCFIVRQQTGKKKTKHNVQKLIVIKEHNDVNKQMYMEATIFLYLPGLISLPALLMVRV